MAAAAVARDAVTPGQRVMTRTRRVHPALRARSMGVRRRLPRDPFFDKPYEPSAAGESAAPSWEATARPAARSISANIKPKLKVAALFKST
jgi:hypothetical protein